MKRTILLSITFCSFLMSSRAQTTTTIDPTALSIDVTQGLNSSNPNLPQGSNATITASVQNLGSRSMITNSFEVFINIDTAKVMWSTGSIYDPASTDGKWTVTQLNSYGIKLRNTGGSVASFETAVIQLNIQEKPTAALGDLETPLAVSVPTDMIQTAGTDADPSPNSNHKGSTANIVAPLPVTLTNFTVTKQGINILLNWITAMELNNDHFEIERSANGKDFTRIGIVKGAGTSNATNQYSFTDGKTLAGINYYRLKQVDADGKSAYSKIVSVRFDMEDSIAFYPNPVKDQLMVTGLAGGEHIIVYNSLGQKITDVISTTANEKISFRNIAAGSYIVVVVKNNQRIKSEPIIKK